MIVQPDFLDHPKTRMLVTLTGNPCAPLAVLRLWGFCQQRRAESFEIPSGDYFKAICRWDGDGDGLLRAMTTCGFVHVEGRRVTVHQWAAYNASLFAAWNNGAKGGRPAKPQGKTETQRKPTGNPAETHGKPSANPDGTDKSRVDEIRGEGDCHPPPTLREVEAYAAELGLVKKEAARFYDYYKARNWRVDGERISDWRALFRVWKSRGAQLDTSKASAADYAWKRQIRGAGA